jgi:NADH dehydrogenase
VADVSRSRAVRIGSWILRLLCAGILGQTLFFKFSGSSESVYIFTTLGMEPAGRIGTGLAELAASILLLVPATAPLGAALSVALMAGAIGGHLTKLGIEVQGDGGLLFGLALTVLASASGVLWLERGRLAALARGLARRSGLHDAAAEPSCPHAPGTRRRVMILGGGFGGLYTALELERTLARDSEVEVMLVNRENFFLFTPMLHEVAASDLDLTNIVSPVRKLLRRVRFFQGDVLSVDLEGRAVTLCHGTDRHCHEIPFDQLVLALGSITNFFGLPGLAERALTMRSLGDAMYLRNRLIASLEEADTECATTIREPLLTFVVAGGGFAGVETIASVNDFLRAALPFYPNLRPGDIRVVLVHSGELILPELGPELGRYAARKLSERGIEVMTGARVSGVGDDGVVLKDGTVLRTRTLVWTAGTSPHPLLSTLPCEKERGRLKVNEYLEVAGHPGVWALGDCALVPDAKRGGFHPPTAQHALREGRVAARNVVASLRGGTLVPFRFTTLGQLAAIGRRTGVARMFGMNFSGFVAWWLWRTIYLGKLPRLEKKVRVALDWTLDLFFSKDLVQFLTERAPVLPGTTVTEATAAGHEAAPEAESLHGVAGGK